jgi:hypothetical protein
LGRPGRAEAFLARSSDERKVEKVDRVEQFKPASPSEDKGKKDSKLSLKVEPGHVLGFVGKAIKKGVDILDSAFPDNKPKKERPSPEDALRRLSGGVDPTRPTTVVKEGDKVLVVQQDKENKSVEVVSVKK